MMTRTTILILLLLLGGHTIHAQQSLDSLERKLSEESNDSIRFQLLIALSKESEFYDYAKARKYATDATILSEKLNAPWAKGKLLLSLAFLETMEGDYAEALRYDLQCTKLYSEMKDSLQLSKALNDVGTDYRDLGEYDDGYYYLTEGYLMASKHFKIPHHDDSLMMAITLHNIGTLFTELGQFDIALAHLSASFKLFQKLKFNEGTPYAFDELGELYRRKKELDQSEKYLFDALDKARKQKIRVLIPRIQSHLAKLYMDRKDFDKSMLYYDSVFAQQTNINNKFGLAECDLGKGMLMSRSGNFEQALKFYFKSLSASKELNARNLALSCYQELAALYEVKKDFEKSLFYLKQHDILRDSIFSEASMEKLSQNQVRFETVNKDGEIATLSQARLLQTFELRRQELIRNILVIVVALTAILLFAVYRSGTRRKRINGLLLEHQEEIKKRSAELEQLNQVKAKFFSIISHDLRSPINALAGTLDLLEQKHITQQEFSNLSKNLRTQFNHTRALINNLLDWTLLQMDKLKIEPEKVILFQKVEESFVELRNLHPKNISMENKVSPEIVAYADPNIVNLVLRNLIFNAIKFTETGGRIWVDAIDQHNEITVFVSDNGIGISAQVKEVLLKKVSGYSSRGTANEKGTGLGLILCKEFIEKNGGRIWLESEVGKGTTFYFTLPKAISNNQKTRQIPENPIWEQSLK